MMTNLLAFLGCLFCIGGLLLYMCGPAPLLALYRQMGRKRAAVVVLACAAAAVLTIHTKAYLVFFLILEYAAVLFFGRHAWEKYPNAPLRGIGGILIMLAAELGTAGLFYCLGMQDLTAAKIRVLAYLSMATVLFCLVILRESRGTELAFKKMLMMALEVKAVENLIWLAICIRGGLFMTDYIPLTIWFVFTMVMCYIVFFIVLYKVGERVAIEKRADIHVNAYEYYMHMEEEHLQVRRLYHEMKNQLMILQNETGERTAEDAEQVQAFAEKLDDVPQFYHTGIASLDILLFDGKMKAESKGIAFDATVTEGCLSFMREEDINVIFSNAIINAIEACEKMPCGPKAITIKAGKNMDDILIYIKNTVAPAREKGTLQTGKKNKRVHGIGMTSIQECVQRYHGYVSIVEENDTFQLAILFGGIKQ